MRVPAAVAGPVVIRGRPGAGLDDLGARFDHVKESDHVRGPDHVQESALVAGSGGPGCRAGVIGPGR
jgi:hypothetical protein